MVLYGYIIKHGNVWPWGERSLRGFSFFPSTRPCIFMGQYPMPTSAHLGARITRYWPASSLVKKRFTACWVRASSVKSLSLDPFGSCTERIIIYTCKHTSETRWHALTHPSFIHPPLEVGDGDQACSWTNVLLLVLASSIGSPHQAVLSHDSRIC